MNNLQKEYQEVFAQIKLEHICNNKRVIHISAEPDYDSSLAIEEYENYCEKLGLSSCHVQSEWLENYLYNGKLYEVSFVSISKELDYLVSNSKTVESREPQKEKEIYKVEGDVIYFLLFRSSRLLKIGFTSNLQKRITAYKTHSAEEFILVKTIAGTQRQEKLIHSYLKAFRQKGEFFEWNDIVKKYIEKISDSCLPNIRRDILEKINLFKVLPLNGLKQEYSHDDIKLKGWLNTSALPQKKLVKETFGITIHKNTEIIPLINKLLDKTDVKLRLKQVRRSNNKKYYSLQNFNHE